MNRRVQVSGLGAVCANGLNVRAIFESCLQGHSTVNDQGLSEVAPEFFEKMRALTPHEFSKSKCTVLGFQALTEALNDSGWPSTSLKDAGFIYATTTGKIDLWEKTLCSYDAPDMTDEKIKESLAHHPLGTPLLELAQYFGIKGPMAQISSSCSASLQAVAMGMKWIQLGKVDRCLVGTTEIHNDLTRVGFNSLRLISKSICKPFDRNRTGINLGEAGAFLLLEKQDDKEPSKWGTVAGAGLSSDAFHPTSPHPEGRGSIMAMRKAIQSAGLDPSDIDWVYAHGTGSPANDLAEAQAIQSLFSHKPPVTSTKSLHGHTLGACGVLESALGILSMKRSLIMPNSNLEEVDPKIQLHLPTQPIEKPFSHFLKNSLGFGGINVSVVFSNSFSESNP